MFHILTCVTSLAVPLPVSPSTAHSSDAHHLAAGASEELRWNVLSYTQVSADVSWSRSHYSLHLHVTITTVAQEYQYLKQGEVRLSHSYSMEGIFLWLLSQLCATQTALNFPRTLTCIFSVTSSINQSFP